jgi:hypothetical protein
VAHLYSWPTLVWGIGLLALSAYIAVDFRRYPAGLALPMLVSGRLVGTGLIVAAVNKHFWFDAFLADVILAISVAFGVGLIIVQFMWHFTEAIEAREDTQLKEAARAWGLDKADARVAPAWLGLFSLTGILWIGLCCVWAPVHSVFARSVVHQYQWGTSIWSTVSGDADLIEKAAFVGAIAVGGLIYCIRKRKWLLAVLCLFALGLVIAASWLTAVGVIPAWVFDSPPQM